jgi:hypothetical protein
LSFIPSGLKVLVEGKLVSTMMSGLEANAYATGNEVHFGNATPQQRLLGHELTHVVQ